jgi:hypothetical protein
MSLMICSPGEPAPIKTIQDEAKAASLSWSSIRRASDLMVVMKKKGGYTCHWKLNDRDAARQGSQEAQLSKREPLEHHEANRSQSTRDEGDVEVLGLTRWVK